MRGSAAAAPAGCPAGVAVAAAVAATAVSAAGVASVIVAVPAALAVGAGVAVAAPAIEASGSVAVDAITAARGAAVGASGSGTLWVTLQAHKHNTSSWLSCVQEAGRYLAQTCALWAVDLMAAKVIIAVILKVADKRYCCSLRSYLCMHKGGRSPLAGRITGTRCLASVSIQGPKLLLTPVNDATHALCEEACTLSLDVVC